MHHSEMHGPTRHFVFLSQSKATATVNLGCGRGSFLRSLALTDPNVHGVGIDLDSNAIAFAQRAALQDGVADQVVFEVGDPAECRGPFDAAICIGSSHVFGDASAMFAGIAELVPQGVAIIGDGLWAGDPR
jgi:cyclopropane fatty-acyl-phospholipid synthase-like methyltransferase